MTSWLDGLGPAISLDLSAADLQEWPNPSIEQIRDAILDGRISNIALDPDDKAESEAVLGFIVHAAGEAVRAGRTIDAGHIPNAIIQSEAKRAKKLIVEQWIGQPFREPWLLIHTWEEGIAPLIVIPDPQGGPDVQIGEFIPVRLKGKPCLMVGDFGLLHPGINDTGEEGFRVHMRLSPLKQMHAAKGADQAQLLREAACNVGDPVWTVLAMLATDGVPIETIPPPAKLNKQRAAKGRPPIPGRQRVDSKPYITALLARLAGKPKGTAQGGHHASPVVHVRRGHPRVIPSGKRVWVRDSIIGAKEGSPSVHRSHYEMKPGEKGEPT